MPFQHISSLTAVSIVDTVIQDSRIFLRFRHNLMNFKISSGLIFNDCKIFGISDGFMMDTVIIP